MSQTECKVPTIDARANTTISAVESKSGFPAIWHRRAKQARGRIYKVTDNCDKLDVFSRELGLLRDRLCAYAGDLFAPLFEVANESGIKNPYDWAEAQTRAGLAKIEKGSIDLRSFDRPEEVAGKHEDNITCWIIVACSCRAVVANVPDVHYLQAPGWLVRWHPDSGIIRDEPDWFSPEDTEAIITNINKWFSSEIGKAIDGARSAFIEAAIPAPSQVSKIISPLVSPAASEEANIFRKAGDRWTVRYRGSEPFYLNATKGCAYLAYLLVNPGSEIPVLNLISAVDGVHVDPKAENQAGQVGKSVAKLSSNLGEWEEPADESEGNYEFGPESNEEDVIDYKAQLREIELELARAEKCNDLGRIEQLKQTKNMVLDEMLHGNAPLSPINKKKAQSKIQKQIKATLTQINEYHRGLFDQIMASIKTGYTCCYKPPADNVPDWHL